MDPTAESAASARTPSGGSPALQAPAPRPRRLAWAELLWRVFDHKATRHTLRDGDEIGIDAPLLAGR